MKEDKMFSKSRDINSIEGFTTNYAGYPRQAGGIRGKMLGFGPRPTVKGSPKSVSRPMASSKGSLTVPGSSGAQIKAMERAVGGAKKSVGGSVMKGIKSVGDKLKKAKDMAGPKLKKLSAVSDMDSFKGRF